jgi:hypothetical protein
MNSSSLSRSLARFAASAIFLCAGLLSACGGGGSSPTTSSPTASPADLGSLRVALTDAPACGYDAVFVTVREVRAHQSPTATEDDAGWASITLPRPQRIDLLTLTNGALHELGQTPLEPGRYTQLRLVLAENTAAAPLANAVQPTGQAPVALETPSAWRSGLKMNVDVEVSAQQIADVVIDFDACQSVVRAGASGRHLLKPVLRVTPRYLSGVRGHLDLSAVAGAAVTLQTGGTVVKATAPDLATGVFRLAPVAPGTYDLVITAPGRTTAVITGVKVLPDTLTDVSDAPLAPLACDCGTVQGRMTAPATPLGLDALVQVHQTLGSPGPSFEIARTAVDTLTGEYRFALPVVAPVVAAFSASGAALSFAPATAAAGIYEVRATAAGVTQGPVAVTVNITTPAVVDFLFP